MGGFICYKKIFFKNTVKYGIIREVRMRRIGANIMIYKNVDICDLESILTKGILSMDESGNNNWMEDKRADNRTDVVYLFKPITERNSFPNYGVALLEVDVEATKNTFEDIDIHKNDYEEYITAKVPVENIKAIYIPEVFRPRVDLPAHIMERITWCGLKFKVYNGDQLIEATDDIIEVFARTAPIMSSIDFNFFRGIKDNGEILDIYGVRYDII